MRVLLDVNVWLALAFEVHAHQGAARAWFDSVGSGTALWCRVTQQGFLRLASNPSVFGAEALTLQDAWSCYDALSGDERTGFAAEAAGLERLWREYTSSRTYSPKVWNDAYLVAFASSARLTMVTFDRAIASYPQSRPLVLSAPV
jgi:toxin-antitoxin system PIN domain toxin